MAGAYNPITGIYEQDPTFKAGTDGTLTPAGSGYSDMGNIDLRQYGMGGEWAGGQNLKSGGSANSFGTNDKGLMYFGVDSEDTAKALQKKYGGTISTGARSNIAGSFDPDGPGGYRAAQTGSGQGYYYTPPGTKPEDQMKVGHEMGVFSDPSFMDKYGWLVAAIASGVGLAAVPAIAGAAGAVGAEGAAVGTAGEGLAGSEAAMLGGPAVGTGSELTAAQMLAGSEGLGLETFGSNLPAWSTNATPWEVGQSELGSGFTTSPAAGPTVVDGTGMQGLSGATPLGTTGPAYGTIAAQNASNALSAAGITNPLLNAGMVNPELAGSATSAAASATNPLLTKAATSLIPKIASSLIGGKTPAGSPTGSPSSNPFGSAFGSSSNMVSGSAANETPGMQAQSAVPQGQTQQLAQALMLGGQAQPQFGSVGYTPVSQGVQQNAQMMALAKALQGDNDNG